MGNENGRSSQGEVNEFLSSSPDDITPLDDKDMLTDMAAASGKGGPTGSETEAFSTRQKGMTLTPLGDELFDNGNLGDVFFDFDAVAIRSDAASTLHANAQMLKAHFDNHQVIIEGHCDERGTVEYNLVLGERRAQTTKQYLVDLGVSSAAIQTISYGKEKPFCTASQPDCWKMNRRGHFVVQ
jgi:peptidoglycan-associated lipoprotein